MRLFVAMLGLVLWVGATGCVYYNAPVVPPIGLFSDIKAPMDVDLDQSKLGSKVGRTEVKNVLGVFSWGDASIATAAKNGKIKTLRHADYDYFSFLGIFTRFTTVVYGD